MAKFLFTADLHLTHRAADAYRWEVFPWLRKQLEVTRASTLFILGDLTDLKDNHPASLVNRMVEELEKTAANTEVIILSGNHDYTDRDNPFFRFLGQIPNVLFVHRPGIHRMHGKSILMLPHTKPLAE
jgi:UDP-2,3-diacylglucosamine pyrophosphatase LpxH